MATYYVVRTGRDHYDLRQTRFKREREAGREHPHDLIAGGFTAQGMRDVLAKHFAHATVDTSALPPLEG